MCKVDKGASEQHPKMDEQHIGSTKKQQIDK